MRDNRFKPGCLVKIESRYYFELQMYQLSRAGLHSRWALRHNGKIGIILEDDSLSRDRSMIPVFLDEGISYFVPDQMTLVENFVE